MLLSLSSVLTSSIRPVRASPIRPSFRALFSTKALSIEDGSHNSARIIINDNVLSSLSPADSTTAISAAVAEAKVAKKASCWVQLQLPEAHSIIPAIHANDFVLHHTGGGSGGNQLHYFKWLKNSESMVPEFATHHVGVGGLVLNPARDQILLVRELRNSYSKWKCPGGLVDRGEGIERGVVREVFEETGVKVKFQRILTMRESHGMQFGTSDLYCVCECVVEGEFDENFVSAQANEIAEVKWVSFEEFKKLVWDEEPHPMMQHVLTALEKKDNDGGGVGLRRKEVPSIVPGRKPGTMYLPFLGEPER